MCEIIPLSVSFLCKSFLADFACMAQLSYLKPRVPAKTRNQDKGANFRQDKVCNSLKGH